MYATALMTGTEHRKIRDEQVKRKKTSSSEVNFILSFDNLRDMIERRTGRWNTQQTTSQQCDLQKSDNKSEKKTTTIPSICLITRSLLATQTTLFVVMYQNCGRCKFSKHVC